MVADSKIATLLRNTLVQFLHWAGCKTALDRIGEKEIYWSILPAGSYLLCFYVYISIMSFQRLPLAIRKWDPLDSGLSKAV